MAWIKTHYGNAIVAPISKFVCDSAADVTDLPKNVVFGSEAVVLANGDKYFLSSTGTWTKVV